MIITFPALCSTTIDKNILPGIGKALELYVITYLLEDVLKKETTQALKKNIKTKRWMLETYSPGQDPKSGAPASAKPSEQKSGKNKPFSGSPSPEPRMKPSDYQVGIDKPWSQEISLAPTWVKVDTPTGSKVIGVKVVMLPVKSDRTFIDMLGKDLDKKGFFRTWNEVFVRGLMRKLLKPWDAILRTIGLGGSITTDPKHDVVMARTKKGDNIFCVYDYATVQHKLGTPRKIGGLLDLYWSSMVFCDDANSTAYFCMKEASGICNMMPYRMLFSMSRQSEKIYNDLSELSSASSSIFRRKKTKLSKLFSENYAINKISKYKNLLEKN